MRLNLARRIQLQLAFVGVLLGLAAAEVAAKTFFLGTSVRSLAKERREFLDREGALAGGLREEGHYERSLALHPLWGYGGRPGKLAVNRFGFFSSKEPALCGGRVCLQGAEANDLVVGVFGGSLALQLASDEGALERALAPKFPGRRVRVVNFALPGHAAPQTLAAYQYFRAVVGLAVFVDGLNEIWNPAQNNQRGYPPVFAKAEHYRLLAGEAEGDRREITRLRGQLRTATERSLLPVWNRFTLSHAVWAVERSYLLGRIAKAGGSGEGAETGAAKPFFAAGEAELVELGLSEWENTHLQAGHIAKRAGAGFVHFLQPSPFVTGKKLTAGEQEIVAGNPRLASLVRLAWPGLQQRGRSLGVINLGPALHGAAETLWIDGSHLNEKGVELLRSELVRVVGEAGRARR